LPTEVLVVDEASMVDVALMAKLLEALSPQARLILLGDKHQLSSVEAGSVLGDVCGDVPGPSKAFRSKLEAVTGAPLSAEPRAAPPVRDAVVLLRRSYRFGSDSGIGRLANAVNTGDGASVVKMLKQGEYEDVTWKALRGTTKLPRQVIDVALNGYQSYLKCVQENAPPKTVIKQFNGFRALCALRQGPFGVGEINVQIEQGLRARHVVATNKTWYPGRPIMVTRNDYTLQLYNGDLGIALPDPDQPQRIVVFFEGAGGTLRGFSPARLPPLETAFVMTVHKSQGSEFDNVLIILPPDDFRLLTRELLYTGITRARRCVEIWGDCAVIQKAVERKVERSSGLYDKLWHEEPFIT
jgi:exodeoxyribonuclease V alpha subunit